MRVNCQKVMSFMRGQFDNEKTFYDERYILLREENFVFKKGMSFMKSEFDCGERNSVTRREFTYEST